MNKFKFKYLYSILLVVLIVIFILPLTAMAADIRPVLLEIKKAERFINRAVSEIKEAENEARIFDSDRINRYLEKAGNYLEAAEKSYEDNDDGAVRENTIRAIKLALKARVGTAESIPVQVRGFWLDSRTIAAAGGRTGLQNLLDNARNAGFNLVLPEVFFKGKTIIPSNELFVQDERFTGWEEDPLAVIIEEASRRGMEVHAWVWVFNENTRGQPGIILEEHPEWANKDREGNIVTYHDSTWLSPAREEVRGFLVDRYIYLVDNYALDGINLDYIRFPEEYRASYGFDDYTVSLFKKEYGLDPYGIKPGSSEAGEWNQFREGLITGMVAYTSDILRKRDPDLLLSADVIPGREEARYRVLQDWGGWLDRGYIDFVLPMTYTDNLFDELSAWLREVDINSNHLLFPGISVFKLTPEQVVEQVVEINEINPAGLSLFAAAHLEQEH
ncbi:MAG: glycoside hydrolase family 10 protein, partial [Halanaerobiales bacterium]